MLWLRDTRTSLDNGHEVRRDGQPGPRSRWGCLISTTNVASLYNVFPLARGENVYDDDRHMFDPEEHGYEPHLREYTAAELMRALAEHGVKCESVVYSENRRLSDQFWDNV